MTTEFDRTMGHPGEGTLKVLVFGFIHECGGCDLTAWRVSRAGDGGVAESAKTKGGGELRC